MTTIVFKEGKLAFDTQISDGGNIVGYCDKAVYVCGGDIIVASAGSFEACTEFEKFISEKEYNKDIFKEPVKPLEALVIYLRKRKLETYTNSFSPEVYSHKYYVLGSGAQIAMGALEMGASAFDAVRIAAKVDLYTGGEIKQINVW